MTLHAFKNFSSSSSQEPLRSNQEIFEALLSSEEKATLALNDPKITGKYSMDKILDIVCSHASLAHMVTGDADLHSYLSEDGLNSLTELGKKHLSVAKSIIQNAGLLTKLGDDRFIELGIAHLEVARIIMNNKEYYSKLASARWTRLGVKHFQIALYIRHDEELWNDLDRDDLVNLGQAHFFWAEFILKTPSLRKQLNSIGLALICSDYPILVRFIIKDVDFLDVSNGLALYHLCKHLEMAKEIVVNEDLKLDWGDVRQLIILGRDHTEVVPDILKHHGDRFTADHLTELGRNHPANAECILQSKYAENWDPDSKAAFQKLVENWHKLRKLASVPCAPAAKPLTLS